MAQHTRSTGIAITCNVRATSVVEPVDSTIESLQEDAREGVIDELAVETWPDEVVLDGDAVARDVEDRFRRYERWADTAGVSIRPPFTVAARTTLTSDEPRTILTLPVCCLAVRVHGTLELVAPHETDGTTYTVDDLLDDLAGLDRDDPSATTPRPTPSAESAGESPGPTDEECPDCGEPLVTGQGVYACPACAWSSLGEDAVIRRPEPDDVTPKSPEGDHRVTPPAE